MGLASAIGHLNFLYTADAQAGNYQTRAQIQFAQETPQLSGLYARNPKRATPSLTTEQLLRAFNGITLYVLTDATAEISPLRPLQEKILDLMGVPLSAYPFK